MWAKKEYDLSIRVPTPDMVTFELEDDFEMDSPFSEGMGSDGIARSIWPLIYPKWLKRLEPILRF